MRLIIWCRRSRVRLSFGVGGGCASATIQLRESVGGAAHALGRSRPGRHLAEHRHGGVPSERPAELAGRSEVTDEEFAERQAQASSERPRTTRTSSRPLRAGATAPVLRHIGWNGQTVTAGFLGGRAGRRQVAADDASRPAARGVASTNTYVMFSGFATTPTWDRTIGALRAACSGRRSRSSTTTATRFSRCPATS